MRTGAKKGCLFSIYAVPLPRKSASRTQGLTLLPLKRRVKNGYGAAPGLRAGERGCRSLPTVPIFPQKTKIFLALAPLLGQRRFFLRLRGLT